MKQQGELHAIERCLYLLVMIKGVAAEANVASQMTPPSNIQATSCSCPAHLQL